MAQVPYSPVQQELPSPGGTPFQHIDADPGQFGAMIGQSLKNVGQQVTKIQDHQAQLAQHYADIETETKVNQSVTDYTQELGAAQNEYRQLEGTNRVNALPAYEKRIRETQQKYAEAHQDPASRLMFLKQSGGYTDRALTSMGTLAGDAASAARDGSQLGAIQTAQASAVRNFGLADIQGDINDIITKTATYAHSRGWNKAQADAEVQKNVGKVYQDLALSRIAVGDTAGARKILDTAGAQTVPGTDLPIMDAGSQVTILRDVEQREDFDERHAATERARIEKEAEDARKKAAEASGNAIITQLIKDPTKVSMSTIANDPHLDWREKNELARITKERIDGATGGDGDKDAKTYGTQFYNLYQRVNAADGDPTKLTDPTKVYPLVGHGLTVSGADKLIAEINGKRTPEGDAESAMKAQFFKNAHASISGADDFAHWKDPKGEEIYLRFMAQSLNAYTAGKAAGKTPSQLLNPDSPDYIGKSIPTFKRPMSEWMADQVNANDPNAPAGTVAPAAPAASLSSFSSPQALVDAVRTGKITRRQGEEEALKRGYIRPGNPSPKPVASGVTVAPAH